MFKYLKDYRWADMRQILDNDRSRQMRSDAGMAGKLCVITGCTSGVGWEAAKTLAIYGATIIMINRNRERSERACDVLRSDSGAE